MDGLIDGDGWIHGLIDGWIDGLIDGDGWIKINGLIDGWMY